VDWNSDGLWDIVSGDRNGFLNVFIRDTLGGLTPYYQYRAMDSTIMTVTYNSQPAVLDWDGDGNKDLLLGSEAGYIWYYRNLAGDSWPMFQSAETVRAGSQTIFYNRVNPYIFDLDRDGRRDLVCGANDGYVRFFRNLSDSVPEYADPETLLTQSGTPVMPSGSPYGSRIGLCYWNSDSLPDLLISGYDGLVELFYGAEMTGTQEGGRPAVRPVEPTFVNGVLRLPGERPAMLLDAAGRVALRLAPGDNGTQTLREGVYYVVPASGRARKVVVNR
jgi:hypothetical protein